MRSLLVILFMSFNIISFSEEMDDSKDNYSTEISSEVVLEYPEESEDYLRQTIIALQEDFVEGNKARTHLLSVTQVLKRNLEESNKLIDMLSTQLKSTEKELDQFKEQSAKRYNELIELFELTNSNTKITLQDELIENKKKFHSEIINLVNMNSSVKKGINRTYASILLVTIVLISVMIYMYISFNRRLREAYEIQHEALILDKLLLQVESDTTNDRDLTHENERGGDDHNLALKIADEVTRLQSNISRLDPTTKGIKPIQKGMERIFNNLLANGYEVTDLIGHKYDEGLALDVINFLDNKDLENGERIITKVVSPQVIYNGKLIQRAQVEVTQN